MFEPLIPKEFQSAGQALQANSPILSSSHFKGAQKDLIETKGFHCFEFT